MMQLDGVARDELRELERIGRRAVDAYPLAQLVRRTPLHHRTLLDPLDVIEEEVDEVDVISFFPFVRIGR
jgi:hypothetical protein